MSGPKHQGSGSNRGMAMDGFKPLTEGYQPFQKGYTPSASAATAQKPPPTGGSSAMTPQAPQQSAPTPTKS